MLDELREDARQFHRLRYPGREPTAWSLASVVLGSRGWMTLAAHRLVRALLAAGEARSSALQRRALRTAAAVLRYGAQLLTKSELRVTTDIAPGVYLSDRGNVILGARTVGRGSVIHHRVTVGWSLKETGTPEVGERVWIGPDSVVAGNIRIGDGATILPRTVLTRSVPPRTLVQGNPARIVRRDFDNSALLRSLATDVATEVAPEGEARARRA